MQLKSRKIMLGVTGGIAAYKALELTRLFIRAGATVRPVMTRAATEFITPLSLSTLARSKVQTDMFGANEEFDIDHISLAQECDVIVVAPATANIIAKVAAGIADDLLSTIIAAATVPVLFAPAMNTAMWESPILQANIRRLSGLGFHFVEPARGELACGTEGKGKLADVTAIFEAVGEVLGDTAIARAEVKESAKASAKHDLAGETVLVTAGPTREAIDPVRYVSNRSSGRMGYALAAAAKERGADVLLISGPTGLTVPAGVRFTAITTAKEMHEACMERYGDTTLVIMAAAIADYAPVNVAKEKLKKSGREMTVEMERTLDVLKSMSAERTGQLLVGFALETENLLENAIKKLKEKGLDMVVANGVSGIDSEQNRVTILDSSGGIEEFASMDKVRVAEKILDHAVALLGSVQT
jgi:phosphopantothenoylcysteine decarboxylase/phosphopantothenate--cysteine ligase